ncbi:chitinase [Allocatelliglobosispora scoriae]|uniref:chitinase n=1 Tax=Allocatelliglobosispora scoriae TaxID=643052 RepID=A0A841BZM9_9ACTN|nr:glycoside hydrolase family 18 protein [Allocatelliglobosispora scoriae]MBB5873046.1 chitinase [Allocatelliglobosispora scoriae]
MRRRRAFALVVAMAAGMTLPASAATAGGHHEQPRYQRVGYFTQWGIYDRGFLVRNLVANGQAARMTVLNYAFGNVTSEGLCTAEGDAWADYQLPFAAAESVDGRADVEGQPLAGNFNQLRKLKKRYPDLKVNLSLGGWTWSKYFSDAALTPQSRRAFVASCVDLFIKGNLPVLDGDTHGGPRSAAGIFDGIDLDWEWPGSPGNDGNVVRPEDKQNFTALVAEFRRQLDAAGRQARRHYALTAFLPADPQQIDNGYEVRKVFRDLDFATVQGYDMHGSTWELTTNHQSALFPPSGEPQQPDFTVSRAVDALLSRGAPRSKLVVGVPFYGYGWSDVPDVDNGLFQQGSGPAPSSADPGYEDYRNIVKLLDEGFTLHRDPAAGFAWVFDGSTFWTIDDPVVLAQKMRYIKANGLGGAMAWSLDADDEQGSLMRAIERGLR